MLLVSVEVVVVVVANKMDGGEIDSTSTVYVVRFSTDESD